MSEREVVITGTGLVTPLGNNVKDNWESLLALKTGIAHYPADDLPLFLQYMGKIKQLEVPEDIPHKLLSQMKFLNRGSLLGFASAREAVSVSGVDISNIAPSRRALYIASGDFTKVGYDFMYPSMKDGTNSRWQHIDYEKLNTSTLDKVNPFYLLESIYNNLFSFLSAFFEFMGPNTSLASLSPSGAQALELSYRSIKHGKADIALAVGCGNWITEIPLYELEGLGILSKCKAGTGSYRPFDRNRDGFIAGEGGAAIILEESDKAKQRGAEILGTIKGFGNCVEFSTDRSLSIPPKISSRNINLALEEAGITIGDLAFINPHGSGTMKGDRSELNSLQDLLGNKKQEIPICGLKPYTGHMGAASDIAEVIVGIKSIMNRTVPATLNFHESEPEFSDLRISISPQKCEKSSFLSVSYGIGGQSSSIVVCIG
jgi:3-oxoacyl-[acyl-carrier-protein] synthase II